MQTDKYRWIFAIFVGLIFCASISAKNFKIKDYYQLNAGNSWNYTAPPSWKGDYISRMENGQPLNGVEFSFQPVFHYDATNAAKILVFVEGKGIYYIGENFADKTFVRFDSPLLWFPEKLKIGQEITLESGFTRTFEDGKTSRGTFKITQKIVSQENVKVTAGEFKKTLRIESETFWDLGDGRKARSINAYNYAKKVGVVRASARFLIINAEGRETVNRLIETDLKSYKISSE